MNWLYRIMDANFNRAREGLRVVEEVARFMLDDASLAARLKELRHALTSLQEQVPGGVKALLASRDSASDVGASSCIPGEQNRGDCIHLVVANCKRVQEAVRVLEEYGKLLPGAPSFKSIRFNAYILEQELVSCLEKMFSSNDESMI